MSGRIEIRRPPCDEMAPSRNPESPFMILYPAIDLKDGQAVRLLRGEMSAATVFNDDPAAQARQFVEAGA